MSTKDFMALVAADMNKQPSQLQKFTDILEDNFLDEAESLKEVNDA